MARGCAVWKRLLYEPVLLSLKTRRCEVCRRTHRGDQRRQCSLCGAEGCTHCVESWFGYYVCRNCQE